MSALIGAKRGKKISKFHKLKPRCQKAKSGTTTNIIIVNHKVNLIRLGITQHIHKRIVDKLANIIKQNKILVKLSEDNKDIF